MSREDAYHPHKPYRHRKYTKAVVEEWFRIMKEKKWKAARLAREMGFPENSVQRAITAYNFNELE